MARGVERLSARTVQAAKKRGLHADGRGLYLRVGPTGSKSWVYRYRVGDRQHDLGLGPFPAITLADARERALQQQRLRLNGQDPLQARRAATVEKAMSFEDCAERYIDGHAAGWRNGKSETQWRQSLKDYVFPTLAKVPVQRVNRDMVLRCLEPIWTVKSETASRVRGRIESILDWAKARQLRDGENPAVWKGGLEHILPAPAKLARVKHHEAMPYQEIGAFMAELRQQETVAARALEFQILTAARPGEAIGARWDEIDVANRVRVIPGERMKGGKEHRIPLSDAAVAILDALPRSGELIFPGLHGMSLRRAIGRPDASAHGFRSTFAQWAAERTSYPYEVREIALAHQVGGIVERSYQRSDLADKRRRLMDEWSRFCAMSVASGAVVPISA
jgi:integrase